jgi:two-component system chemotaxis response regulator CheY
LEGAFFVRSLVIDDSATIQFLLQHCLAPHGHCDVVQNGQEALDAYQRSLDEGRPYDLICLDLGLPYFSGADVLAKIRAAEAHHQLTTRAHIIVITARHAEEARRICDQGADAYLLKPVDAGILRRHLKDLGLVSSNEKGDGS